MCITNIDSNKNAVDFARNNVFREYAQQIILIVVSFSVLQAFAYIFSDKEHACDYRNFFKAPARTFFYN